MYMFLARKKNDKNGNSWRKMKNSQPLRVLKGVVSFDHVEFLKEFFKPLSVKKCFFVCDKAGRPTKVYWGFNISSFFSLQLLSLVSPPCSLGSSVFACLWPLWDTFWDQKCFFVHFGWELSNGNKGSGLLALAVFLYISFVSFGWPMRLANLIKISIIFHAYIHTHFLC